MIINKNNTEYQTLILAALLHDIGKALNRVEKIQRKHPLFSKDYVLTKEFSEKVKDWIDIELLALLCQRHHEDRRMDNNLLVQEIKDTHQRALAYIVSRADTYSAKERPDEEQIQIDFRKARLMSIFSKVDIGKGLPAPAYYDLRSLTPANSFPKNENEINYQYYDYRRLIEDEFSKAIKKFNPINFEFLFNGYLSILEEFFWAVPSDTTREHSDISLFDHLSTTSAIAACLYQYHCNNLQESEIKKDELEKFLLVGGDLSGIQQFIFELVSTNPKRLSKTLRGRSFYLSLLTEAISFKIIKRLNLPISCRIMNAGGRFILLVPNTKDTKQTLDNLVKQDIEPWFLKTFLGKLSLNFDYSVALSGNDFKSEWFRDKLEELHLNLELKKNQKFKETYFLTDVNKNEFKRVYHELTKNRACSFCGVYPAIKRDDVCNICNDSSVIGERLVSRNYIGFSLEKTGEINIAGVGIDFLNDFKDANKYLLIEKITDKEDENNLGIMERFVANYIPEVKEGDICNHNHKKDSKIQTCNALCNFCKEPCKVEDRHNLYHLTFQCMAIHTLKENNGKGVDHLALLKADVDFLGLIFSMGIDDLSISRYATLARMLNLFFTGWLKDEIKQRFDRIYTVYSGGDDLLLIGPWEMIIEFAKSLNDNFNAFAGGNPNITLSAGIALSKPNSPIGTLSKVAEENLSNSKNTGRDKLTVFETTVNWQIIEDLVEFKDFLNNQLRQENIKSAFLYRLLKYHEMFLEAEEGRIEGLRFHSLMVRDIKRNIEKKDNQGNVINQEVIDRLLPLCAIIDQDRELMINIKIPVFWTLYKNRGG